jgi:hypothetical protein
MRFAFSVTAINEVITPGVTRRYTRNFVGTVEASSRAEALGLATQVGMRAYPPASGWHDHFAHVDSVDNVTTPANVRESRLPGA